MGGVAPAVGLKPENVKIHVTLLGGGFGRRTEADYGISAALDEKVVFVNGEPQQSNFHDYPVLRMQDTPKIHVKVMPSGDKPGGIGEAGLPPVAPAIANAVFKLTRKRLRALPLHG